MNTPILFDSSFPPILNNFRFMKECSKQLCLALPLHQCYNMLNVLLQKEAIPESGKKADRDQSAQSI